jgi:hypothetical protein
VNFSEKPYNHVDIREIQKGGRHYAILSWGRRVVFIPWCANTFGANAVPLSYRILILLPINDEEGESAKILRKRVAGYWPARFILSLLSVFELILTGNMLIITTGAEFAAYVLCSVDGFVLNVYILTPTCRLERLYEFIATCGCKSGIWLICSKRCRPARFFNKRPARVSRR